MHRISLVALVVLGSFWAGLLVVGGALIPSLAAGAWPAMTLPAILLGATVVIAGEYVFLALVADRLFPRASRTLVAAGEILLAGLMLILAAATAIAALVRSAA